MNPGRAAAPVLALVAAAGARTSVPALRRWSSGRPQRWTRRNYRGAAVSLLAGPAFALGAAGALALPLAPGRLRAAALVAVAGAAAVGRHDDLAGEGGVKGLRGHLGAARRGRLTSGTVKVVGLAATGVVSAAVLHGAGPPTRTAAAQTDVRRAGAAGLDIMLAGALVAGCANLANLLDLRPGRALKGVVVCTPLCRGSGRPLAAVAAGAAFAVIAEDLAEQAMLGDLGANAAGALLGVAAAAGASRPARVGLLALVTALTLASEVVSFTQVIEATPVLRALDRLGRRRAATALP